MSLPTITINGVPRKLGCKPPRPFFGFFRRSKALLPRSQWQEVDLRGYGVPVLDQGESSSCVGHGACGAFWTLWRMQDQTVPPSGFSPTSIYSRINGGVDEGAVVSDAMHSLLVDGVSTMDLFPESMLFDKDESAASRAMRKRFRLESAEHVASFDAIGSCLTTYREPIVFGILLTQGFDQLNAMGVPYIMGQTIGGHCMYAVGLKHVGSTWYVIVRNSWGESWGLGGDCLLHEGFFSYGQRPDQLDAFRPIFAASDPLDPNPEPVAT